MGDEAARLGTALHLHCEYDLNGEWLAPNGEIAAERAQYEAFKASEWAQSRGLRPVRTELCVAYRIDGVNVSAGQIDALFVDADGLYYLFDFKRVGKKHKLSARDRGFYARGKPPAMGIGPLSHIPDTHFQRYSLQTSIYNLMLLDTHGVNVGTRMYLLRMHADRADYELVECADLRSEAKAVLAAEHARIIGDS